MDWIYAEREDVIMGVKQGKVVVSWSDTTFENCCRRRYEF